MRITLFGYFPSDFWAIFLWTGRCWMSGVFFSWGSPGTPPLVPKEAVRKALLAEPYDFVPSLSHLELHTDYDIAHPVLSEYKKQ